MLFRNYCLVLLGKFNKDSAVDELAKISEIKVNYIYTTGVFMSTFSTILTPNEMKNILKLCKNNFFMFELNDNVSAFNLTDKQIEEGLFGYLKTINLNKMDEDFINDIINDENNIINEVINNNNNITPDEIASIKNIDAMTKEEKEDLLNTIIEKGVENLTDDDKYLLNLLAK
jgi:hypothetical protein